MTLFESHLTYNWSEVYGQHYMTNCSYNMGNYVSNRDKHTSKIDVCNILGTNNNIDAPFNTKNRRE